MNSDWALELAERGWELYEEVHSALDHRAPQDERADQVNTAIWDWLGSGPPYSTYAPIPDSCRQILVQHLGMAPALMSNFTYVANTLYSNSNISYTNFYNPSAAVIIAKSNFSRCHVTGERATDRWSDVVFPVFKTLCPTYGIQPHTLQYVVRTGITNPTTKRLLSEMITGADIAEARFWEFTPADDEFYALLRVSQTIPHARKKKKKKKNINI